MYRSSACTSANAAEFEPSVRAAMPVNTACFQNACGSKCETFSRRLPNTEKTAAFSAIFLVMLKPITEIARLTDDTRTCRP